LFGEGSDEEILVGGVWPDILFGTQLLGFLVCDEPQLKLDSEDSFRRPEVVVVDICHVRDEFNE